MKRHPYYPRSMGKRSEWHTNQATKLPGYSSVLGLTQAEEDNGVADNLVLAYGLGPWIVPLREHVTAATLGAPTSRRP